jgi:hypothetical protein
MQRKLVIILVVFFVTGSSALFAQTSALGEAVETTASGKINWTTGEIFATGIGAPPTLSVNAAQARAMAERAAFVVAIRNLLEIVKGVRVDSETVVENFMTTSDTIRTRVDGIVRGARTVKTQYMSDGSVEVQVAMPMKGALLDALVPENYGRGAGVQPLPRPAPALPKTPEVKQPQPPVKPAEPQKPEPAKPVVPLPSAPEKKPEPAKPSVPPIATTPEKKSEPPVQPEPPKPVPLQEQPTVVFKGGTATGLVIDGRGLGLRPALLPKIVDAQGQEIYVGQVVTRTNAVEQGVAGYAKDVNAAANNFRVTDNPAVLKGLRASGSSRTDVVLGQADAQTLRQLSGTGDFLQYCRVIIVY